MNDRLKDYVEVNVRIAKFYEKYPEGSIQTDIVSWTDGIVVMKAYAYRTPEDPRPATGHAYEKEGSTQVNRTSALENCETSAVGRALALLGFEIKKSVASKEEVENAIHQQENTPQTTQQRPQTQQTNGKPASEKQIGFLAKKAKSKGMSEAELSKWVVETFRKPVNQLTSTEASKAIDALDNVQGGGNRNVTTEPGPYGADPFADQADLPF